MLLNYQLFLDEEVEYGEQSTLDLLCGLCGRRMDRNVFQGV